MRLKNLRMLCIFLYTMTFYKSRPIYTMNTHCSVVNLKICINSKVNNNIIWTKMYKLINNIYKCNVFVKLKLIYRNTYYL